MPTREVITIGLAWLAASVVTVAVWSYLLRQDRRRGPRP